MQGWQLLRSKPNTESDPDAILGPLGMEIPADAVVLPDEGSTILFQALSDATSGSPLPLAEICYWPWVAADAEPAAGNGWGEVIDFHFYGDLKALASDGTLQWLSRTYARPKYGAWKMAGRVTFPLDTLTEIWYRVI